MSIKNDRQFQWQPTNEEPKQGFLYDCHLKLTDKSLIAPFAGYLMPLWYSSISKEHTAVRETAGLFDCTHMGILEFTGTEAEPFLDAITTNNIQSLSIGQARYSYILDAAGSVLDDIIIYKRSDERFMVVVNAANEPKIKAWLDAIINETVCIDTEYPNKVIKFKPVITDLRTSKAADQQKVDIALQGPASVDCLKNLTSDNIADIKPFTFIETKVAGFDVIVSRTGYTGSGTGLEIYVHPDNAPTLWETLLQNGGSFGLQPCGLGARDSLRIEAGLPLYGHELAGKFEINPFETGYGWAVKLEKDFFIGKNVMAKIAESYKMKVVRLSIAGQKGIRPVRQDDAVISEDGECIGHILSCAKAGQNQIALAYCRKNVVSKGDQIGIYYLARNQRQKDQGKKDEIAISEKTEADIKATVLQRFEKFN